jgi:hypothetical protein
MLVVRAFLVAEVAKIIAMQIYQPSQAFSSAASAADEDI